MNRIWWFLQLDSCGCSVLKVKDLNEWKYERKVIYVYPIEGTGDNSLLFILINKSYTYYFDTHFIFRVL